jgi:hypothetical protein
MTTTGTDPRTEPLPKSFIGDLKRAFSGRAQEDAVRAAKNGNFRFLGYLLECPAQDLPREVVLRCLDEEPTGTTQLTHEFEMLQLRRRLYSRLYNISESRRKRARKLGFTS